MKITVTGATGFVGRALVMRLLRDDHEVVALTRDPGAARQLLGTRPTLVSLNDEDGLARAVAASDAVVNLAGENLFARRWSEAFKRRLVSSRVDLTRRISAAIRAAENPPAVLVSASAVGFYGEAPAAEVDESSPVGDDFLARLCRDWEEAADAPGVRVVNVRIGLVLGAGGAMARMLPPFRLGAGGRLGSGRQPMSWIHLRDLVEVLASSVTDSRYEGVINAVSPNPVDNLQFTKALGGALRRPTIAPVPAVALRLVLGEAAGVLLGGQRVRPARLLELGFPYRFSDVVGALADIVEPPAGVEIGPDPGGVVEGRRPQYELTGEAVIDAPLERVFRFFSRAENLALLTPSWTRFQIVGEVPSEVEEGAIIQYRLRLGPIPISWKTEIRAFEPGSHFVDVQLKGPYALWWHEHRFLAEGERTRMFDRVRYRMPLGVLGRIAHALGVRGTLLSIFRHRRDAIELLFGGSPRS